MATGPAIKVGDELFPVNKLTNSVGRRDRITNSTPDVDLANADTERGVSRKHAELTYSKGAILLRDVGSTNGTTVNGETLALQVDRYLQDGDKIGFADVETTFVVAADWPEGVEAEWPPEPVPEPEPEVVAAGAEETMVMPAGAEETMVMPAPEPEETMIMPQAEAAPETYAPPAAAEPVAAEPAEAYTAPVAETSVVFTPCSNHPHLPALGVCPGCLEAFCVDCLPERPGQPLTCTRCAGIQVRLGVLVGQGAPAGAPAGDFQPAPGFAPPPAAGFPPPPEQPPQYTPPPPGPQQAEPDKKKKWPF